jgi:hypothetical protein
MFFMDKTDFDYELGYALNNEIYTTEEEILKTRKCSVECGIVEIEILECEKSDDVIVFVPNDFMTLKSFKVHVAKIPNSTRKAIRLKRVTQQPTGKYLQ